MSSTRPPQSHSSRPSVSSSVSSKSERSSDRADRSNPPVESAVTRLLVSIKQLLESLTQWSTSKVDETHVSDVYVRLGNDFNEAVAAFAAFNIDMSELMGVPTDLRHVLEQCLSEEATPENLDLFLPTVRQIITGLLQGLRVKQAIYRRIVSDHRHKTSSERASHDRTASDSRSSRSSKRERAEKDGGSLHRSQLSRTLENDSNSLSHRTTPRRKDTSSTTASASASTPSLNSDDLPPTTPTNEAPDRNGVDGRKQRSSPSDPYVVAEGGNTTRPIPEHDLPPLPHSPPPPPPPVPATVKRYSLVDKPVPPPAVVVDEPSSPPVSGDTTTNGGAATPPFDTTTTLEAMQQVPGVANSLAALKKSDTLERRASKRFSTYNISKMTGGSARERTLRGGPGHNRRSLAAVSSSLTPGELAVLTEVDEPEVTVTTAGAGAVAREGSSRSSSRRAGSRPVTPDRVSTPPVPPLPATPSRTPEPDLAVAAVDARPSTDQHQQATGISTPSARAFTVFLQLGREVKKATIEPGLSFPSLRMLFVDKFSYNPGLDNFPAIYIRDPSSGVQYELEDVDEVKEKCLLSLNIEPLDQIKQHIDSQISALSQDIKDLRSAVAANRHSAHFAGNLSQPLAESTPVRPRPSDRQFQHVARRISQFVVGKANNESSSSARTPPSQSQQQQPQQIAPQTTGTLQPQMTGGSVLSEYSSRVVSDLKTQFDEVQNLRRDLGIMRQLYTEFMKTTKESLGTLRAQTQGVKQLANTKVGGARGYIDSGKKTLDVRSQNVLTEVEKLQDTVEGVKDDVLKRHITPKPWVFKNIKRDIGAVATELEALKEHITTVKPMWKKTWEEELQNIVEEQQFLSHQEEFLGDLLEDHKAVVEVYGHVEKVISIRGGIAGGGGGGGGGAGGGGGGSSLPRNRSFRPPPPDEGHNGLSTVMLEIRGANVDPDRRLKAIEASQKNREKELASRSDELQDELSEFVGGKRLKMTGGAEEAERVRQRRNELTMKAMFNGGGGGMS